MKSPQPDGKPTVFSFSLESQILHERLWIQDGSHTVVLL